MVKVNIDWPNESVIKISEKGQYKAAAMKDLEEEKKLHTLRVGSGGCILPSGEFIGQNPYIVLGRFMGYGTRIPLSTQNIFDTGIANEFSWESNLDSAGVDWHSGDDDPVVTQVSTVLPDGREVCYPLSGRADLIFSTLNQGCELKAICSVGMTKVLKGDDPKTENLIQAATYSYLLDKPWSLVYSSGFNYYGTKAGKVEFPMRLNKGAVEFMNNGELVETNITISGIMDYYRAIIEAYELKDHSWFDHKNIGFNGEVAQYWNDYNSFLLAVDSSAPWDKWVEMAEVATRSYWVIQLSRKKCKKDQYFLQNVLDNSISETYTSIGEARQELKKRSEGDEHQRQIEIAAGE